MAAIVDIAEIARMLADRVDALVPVLLPTAERDGQEWRCGGVHGEPGRSLAVHRGGSRAGVWADFSTDDRGDALDLVAAVLFGGDKAAAVAWAKSWLGLDGMDPDRLKTVRKQAQRAAKASEEAALQEMEKKRRWAQAMWLEAAPALAGSPVEAYLRGRGIELGELARAPRALRYAPSCRHKDGQSYPAMLAAIYSAEGAHLATHRTYLGRRRDGGWGKIGRDAKLVLGNYRGGFISLARGPSGKALKDAPGGDRVIICEGIEDALSLAICCPDYRVLAAVSVSNFANVRLPVAVTEVILAVDNDAPGSQAAQAVDRAAEQLLDQGRTVRIARPPEAFKDFNDWLASPAAKGGVDVAQG